MNDSSARELTALILAGGQGRRMHYALKGLTKLGELTLVEHVLQRIAGQVDTILICAGPHGDTYARLGYQTVADDHNLNGCGPLAGIVAGLLRMNTPYALVLPCDTPFLPLDLGTRLLAAAQENRCPAAIAVDLEGRAQNLCLVLNRDCVTSIKDFLATGGRAVKDWLNTINVARVSFNADSWPFFNINTNEDIDRARTKLLDFD